jgi:hypothetical protein
MARLLEEAHRHPDWIKACLGDPPIPGWPPEQNPQSSGPRW